MRVLIAEDNPTTLKLMEALLLKAGHDVVCVADGLAAWSQLEHQSLDTPRLAILDWEMPRMQGPDLCRRVRGANLALQPYLILVTARTSRDDLLAGMKAGADDYMTKPVDNAQFQVRVAVGVRVMEMHEQLKRGAKEREDLRAELTEVRKLLPICAGCGKLREDRPFWHEVETYLARQRITRNPMGMCPSCAVAQA